MSGAIHGSILLAATIFAVAQAKTDEAPPVDVKFVKPGIKSAAPPPPPPPPPKKKKTTVHTPNKITAPIVMPEKPPEPVKDEPKKEEEEDDGGNDDGVEGGVEGGVKGGVVGGVVGGVLGGQLGGSLEDVPVYAGAGYTKPRLDDPRCLAESIRIPEALHGVLKQAVVRFSVGPSGQVSNFSIMSPKVLPDPRFEDAIIKGVKACAWTPGTDAKGRHQTIWVVQPIRFD